MKFMWFSKVGWDEIGKAWVGRPWEGLIDVRIGWLTTLDCSTLHEVFDHLSIHFQFLRVWLV